MNLNPTTRVSAATSRVDSGFVDDPTEYTLGGAYVLPGERWYVGANYAKTDREQLPAFNVTRWDAKGYGVLAGLEVMRSLNDHGVVTEAPLEVAIWTNEEGSRFLPVIMGSGVFAGKFPLEVALSARDHDGKSVADELAAIGYAGADPVGGRPVAAYFEAHRKALDFMAKNPEEALAIAAKEQKISIEDARAQLPLYDFTPAMTDADVANLTEDQAFMIEAGMLPKAKAIDLKATLIAPSAFTLR